MKPDIRILDSNKQVIGQTYARRAKQLVSKNKAVWSSESEDTICLLLNHHEEKKQMDTVMELDNVISAVQDNQVDTLTTQAPQVDEVDTADDKLLLYIAGQNVAYKKATGYGIAGMFVFTALLIMGVFDGSYDVFVAGIWFACGLYVAARTFKSYILPMLAGGRNASAQTPLEKEYDRLKKLNAR